MFRVENNVPDVYIQESRDFQLLSRLYDLVFQSSRFSIDTMQSVSDTLHCQDNILPLIATKVGMFTDVKLTTQAHRYILSVFPYIIKYKGSMQGLTYIANLLGRLLNTNVRVEQSEQDFNRVTFYFKEYYSDFNILKEVVEYMRPTGCFVDYVIEVSVDIDAEKYYFNTNLVATNMKAYSLEDKKKSGVVVSGKGNPYYEDESTDTVNNYHLGSKVGFTQIISKEVFDKEGGNNQ